MKNPKMVVPPVIEVSISGIQVRSVASCASFSDVTFSGSLNITRTLCFTRKKGLEKDVP